MTQNCIIITDTGFLKAIQANIKYEKIFLMPNEYCIPAPLTADMELINGSWTYGNTDYEHRDFGIVNVWFLVTTLEDLVYRDLDHFMEIIEYIDGEMDINCSN